MSHGTKMGTRAPSSKIGRNKRKCDRYAADGRRERNKARKAERIIRGLVKARESREMLARIREAMRLNEEAFHQENELRVSLGLPSL
jgi:hypothetical protein